ncbi:ParB/RepB/Spo0J family partition protein [Actinoplanes sp. TFC3]|uniref:ParB/RepB/Spo0J family partition protein n=1 Tax=Actinoplanes sp. TFC3 TaxID=1710355 RepID=UPI000B0CBEC9|nr:ParB/RepB/Spo0J family partition protein [Actinoplanes sp. TFC3]
MDSTLQDKETGTLLEFSPGGSRMPVLGPVVPIPIGELRIGDTPRLSGENAEHVQHLLAAGDAVPPITVHRETMQVIDGLHRCQAARLRGDERISVRFFEGSAADAFVLAVRANVAHGLPLPLADRRHAAARIIATHPHWSNRMIGSVAGLDPRTVADVRQAGGVTAEVRVGQDGRSRPVNGAQGRIAASKLMIANPGMSLRQIAREVGISPETVRDVRNRLQLGEEPVPNGSRPREPGTLARLASDAKTASSGAQPSTGRSRMAMMQAVRRLTADPALRFTDTGRALLRMLHVQMAGMEEWGKIGPNLPPHCGMTVADLARELAGMWRSLADDVEQNLADTA